MSSIQEEFDSPLPGCSLGYHAIPEGVPVYDEQIGWAKRRKGGGLHSLLVRKATGRVACERCVQKARRGIHPDQLSIS